MGTEKKVLAFGAHPDDVEFGCVGTLLLLKELGYEITIVDLTKGEAAKQGATERVKEAHNAAEILGITREIHDLGDGKIKASDFQKVQEIIDKYQPTMVFAPYPVDKHPDHAITGKLVSQIRPTIHYYIHSVEKPNMGVNITTAYSKKLQSIKAHKSQIRDGDLEWLEQRNRESGEKLNCAYGELFFTKDTGKIELSRIFQLLNQ